MANLDTRSKRASSVGLLRPYAAALPLPDGSISAPDRQHIPWTYSGISAAAITVLDSDRVRSIDAWFVRSIDSWRQRTINAWRGRSVGDA